MNGRYKNLLSPLRIGNTIVKNRMAYSNASPHFFQGPETFPAEGYRSFQARLARNGAAIISLAEWDNYPDQRKGPTDDSCRMQAFDMTDPSVHNYVSQLADEVHFYGSKILVCAGVDMPEGYSLRGGMNAITPVDIVSTEMLPRERIPEVMDGFIEKLRLYRRCGYDGVTLRLDLEMQPAAQERTDDYGGDTPVKRMRFFIELMRRIKDTFGKGFIIEVCLAGEQPYGYTGGVVNGYGVSDVVDFAAAADGLIDILQIRERDMAAAHPITYNFNRGEHGTLKCCRALKTAGIKAAVAPNGGFQDPDEMERYIAEGICDMYYLARAFIADFDYVKKIEAGRGEDIRPCLWCNKCHGVEREDKPAAFICNCSVNPLMGIDYKLPRMVDGHTPKKRVAVIGGGVAGMQAAITAAERGHEVTLYEKSEKLGGQLFHGDYFAFKWAIADYRDWLVRELKRTGVTVRLGSAPTPEEISASGYDAVIAATGAAPALPDSIKGLRDESGKALYPTCLDVIGKEAGLGKRVIIVGGSETGTETGMYLADHGHDVTILTRQRELAHDASHLHYITMCYVKPEGGFLCAWEKYDNLRGILNVTAKSVSGNTVTYAGADGVPHTLEADSVVICGGMEPRIDEALAYSGSADIFYAVGDCNGAGNIQACTRDAFGKAMML